MKTCPNCKSEIEENFDVCWNCQYNFSEGRVVPKTELSQLCPHCNIEVDAAYTICPNCQHKLGPNSISTATAGYLGNLEIECLRCRVPMFYKGNGKFREGARTGVFGNLFDLMTNRESFEVYFCPQCGKIEFFISPDTKAV